MAITSTDGAFEALAGGQNRTFAFQSVTTAATRFTLLNAASAQNQWGQMAVPAARGAGGTLINAGDAGFIKWTSAGGGAQDYFMLLAQSGATLTTVDVYDIVWAVSGFSGTTVGAQNITGMPALTRPADGEGLELFAVVWTQIGATPTTLTASYTNSSGTAGRTTIAQTFGGSGAREVYRVIPLPWQVGDTGVQSVQSAALLATTGTAGDFGLFLGRYLGSFPSFATATPPFDIAKVGMQAIDPDTAFGFLCFASTTSSGYFSGGIKIGSK